MDFNQKSTILFKFPFVVDFKMASIPQGAFAACKIRSYQEKGMKVARLPSSTGKPNSSKHYQNEKCKSNVDYVRGDLCRYLFRFFVSLSMWPLQWRSIVQPSTTASWWLPSGAYTIGIHLTTSRVTTMFRQLVHICSSQWLLLPIPLQNNLLMELSGNLLLISKDHTHMDWVENMKIYTAI